jgi:crotonobetainyl-CoA:carnitine CoA-transferase CaiB-like acyl-CoA transferase
MTTARPLGDFVAIEIGHSVAAPYAGMILASLGMEVIKVEHPDDGDAARGWGPPFVNEAGPHFQAFNRDKKSVTANLSLPEQRDDVRRLILERADVVICNLRAGAAERHGLGAREMTLAKPELVYCDIGAFGGGGPLSGKPGYDPLMQAYCGIMSVTGESAERPPIRVGVSIIDMGCGLWAAVGVLSALLERQKTGIGGQVETSLFETAVAWAATPIARYLMGGGPSGPEGSGAAGIVPYQAFRTRDGWLVIGAGNDRLFAALCAVIDRPELAADPRFRRNGDRVRNRRELIPIIEAFAGRHDRDELSRMLDAAGIPNAPVQTIDQIVADEHTTALGVIQKIPGAVPTAGLPLRFNGERPKYERGAPALGADTSTFLDRRD